ncbi:thioredoxin family protein [Clostridium tarantellae]|uniref:Thioredoxin family protein n=1 Tax=Clostridium tarantellae TaxID=39493 RepID=A0A6I1MWV7_9CLOT|nr:thioredoxin family protein [Clostridium tarantellae]MPQ45271.1 hypothetical protein [Clostridium tarantellae]
MIDFSKGVSYEEFIETAIEENKEMIHKFEKQAHISEKGIEDIVCIDEPINVVVFSLTRCKDAATILPYLMQLSDLNNNIHITFFDKDENEDLLKNLSGETRVPTILTLDNNNNIKRKFIEFPKFVYEKILQNESKKEIIINEFRKGKYNKHIQSDLIKLLVNK